MSHRRTVALTAGVLLAFAPFAVAGEGPDRDTAPNGRGAATLDHPGNSQADPDGKAKPGGGAAAGNGINYHGGPVMTGTTKIYYIWYGTWDSSSITVLTNLASFIGGSPYFNINTTYYNGAGLKVSNAVTFGGSTTDNYSLGTNLSDANIQSIVANAINSGRLPNDASGVYFVLTAKDVTATSGFCTQYCGWHTYTTVGGTPIKYSFVGNPETKCPASCSAQSVSPNGNLGADAMASVIAHELEEAVTDPQLNAWYDRRGYENADKCAWTFGTTSTAPNGSKYNILLGGKYQYLIQRNWVNASGGYCALSYP
jgi:phosphate-induced protein 1